MMSYQAFLNRLQKRGSKPHSISHCLGARDAWKWVRKNKWELLNHHPVSHSLYSCVIDSINQILVEQILEGHKVDMPCGMGSFYLSGVPARVAMEEGKMKTNYRTDWLKTLELWYADEEARNSHKTVKRVQSEIISIRYDKTRAHYTNKRFYLFRANRSFVRKVGRAIEERKVNVMKLNLD